MSDRKKAGFAWIVGLLIGLPLLYVVSFGPACWMTKRDPRTLDRIAPRFYWPIGWACVNSPKIRRAFRWYATLGGGSYVLSVPANPSGSIVIGM